MSAPAHLSIASYFKKNVATLSRQEAGTAQVSLFPIGLNSLYSASDSKPVTPSWCNGPFVCFAAKSTLRRGVAAFSYFYFVFQTRSRAP